MATPDMDDVKESVRQGVTKVAGKLSGMASGVYDAVAGKLRFPTFGSVAMDVNSNILLLLHFSTTKLAKLRPIEACF